ncbi:MAG: peptidyl-prolyl cis-trans isomerase [Candidatus Omnitrophica bacterium]|nr:peptidyl-prolyl cis-trans isomerase [Candidatus Omnitrophota bacterium]
MRKLLGLWLGLLVLGSGLAQAATLDRIVAVVNDEIITEREVQRILVPVYEQLKAQVPSEHLEREFEIARERVIKNLIDDKLLTGEAKRLGIEPAEDKVDAKVEEAKKSFGSPEQFELAIEREGITEKELRMQIIDAMRRKQLVEQVVVGQVRVSPAQINQYYEDNKESFRTSGEWHMRMLVLGPTAERDSEQTLLVAKEIHKLLEQGEDFASLAREYSQGPKVEEGGDLGWVDPTTLRREIREGSASLTPGEYSGLIEMEGKWVITFLEERRDGRIVTLDQATPQIRDHLFEEQFRVELETWLNKLKSEAYVDIRASAAEEG